MNNEKTGKFIKIELAKRKLSQELFAEKINLSASQVSQALNGNKGFSIDSFEVIAEVLNVTLDELVKGELISPVTNLEQAVIDGELELEKMISVRRGKGENIYDVVDINGNVLKFDPLSYAMKYNETELFNYIIDNNMIMGVQENDISSKVYKELLKRKEFMKYLILNENVEMIKKLFAGVRYDVERYYSNSTISYSSRDYCIPDSDIDEILFEVMKSDNQEILNLFLLKRSTSSNRNNGRLREISGLTGIAAKCNSLKALDMIRKNYTYPFNKDMFMIAACNNSNEAADFIYKHRGKVENKHLYGVTYNPEIIKSKHRNVKEWSVTFDDEVLITKTNETFYNTFDDRNIVVNLNKMIKKNDQKNIRRFADKFTLSEKNKALRECDDLEMIHLLLEIGAKFTIVADVGEKSTEIPLAQITNVIKQILDK